MIITVDCGSTNMRCRLFDGRKCIDEQKAMCGCRNTAFDGSSQRLSETLRDLVRALLERNSLAETDIEVIVSSGTLASDVGIYNIPHAVAPVGIPESAAAASLAVMKEITSIPILFIPGVKTLPEEGSVGEERILRCESMSGEECENYGIAEALGLCGEYIITLPGSYNKIAQVNADGKITSLRTGMCGEFIAAMSGHTLLRHSLPDPVIQEILPDFLILGYDMAEKYGTSPMLIKARMMQTLGGYNKTEAANFFVGAILHDDIASSAELCRSGKPVILGGGDPLRSIFAILLEHAGVENLRVVDDTTARLASSYGAMRVWDYWKKKYLK